ncbi:nucleoside hydrolase [Tengunoibacter tsumagoiensis]|uniref:Ribosylpyrimidine nucleosidase n=1 Tax=Tengunoibacter tsumagoiensis TaxID=2014871 RepID=A0A401ZZA9_9CHLR|nr:nucleoside hydrolase [Tengunoibacter tsumagoiensis]GCE12190.1 ribosylpyrimidine nucleosidase [Tengunoibacter tsumagoiensis]
MKQKIILDCDPGHDDALAILLAAHHPTLELLAITTVAGNQSVLKTSQNALKVCSLANIRTVPVAMGMERPLLRPARFAPDIHGESGLDGPVLPEPTVSLASQHAVDLMIELLLQSDGDIILVATAPLTNIAYAMRREPAILPKIRGVSLMGGAIGLGNVTPSAEFNIWADPEAAAIVFGCGRPITMVPLEVTHQALATEAIFERLRSSQRMVATFAADLLTFFAESYRTAFGFVAPPVHDPCAVAAVIDPMLIATQLMSVCIETSGEWSSGRTVCDVYGKLQQPANAYVGHTLKVDRFWDLFIDTILTYA